MNPGDIVRHNAEVGGIYRVQAIHEGAADVFGGSRRQARTFPVDELRPATRREAADWERVRAAEAAACRGIKPARSLR